MELLPKLSQNLLEILDDDEYYDITIEVGNDPYVKVFHAHMVILNYRSPYLRRILSTNEKKNDGTLMNIKLSNISPESFQIILRYIYGGKLLLDECDTFDIIKILITASELSLQELIPRLQSFLINNKRDWLEQNFNLIYQTSFENDSFLELQKFCTELMSKEPGKIFNSPDFTSISEKSLITLVENDNLQMSDIKIWEHVLKWGIAQNPELSSDPSSYSNDDFDALKNTLQRCIPFIKFIKFSSKEFLNKVYPYKMIIPVKLYENLIQWFLNNDYNPSNKLEPRMVKEIICKMNNNDYNPNSKLELQTVSHKINNNHNASSKSESQTIKGINIDSKIITIQHAELISKWIDKLEIEDKVDKMKNFYEFKLIFRGSRDGFTPKRFHEICDNQSLTVAIIKVKDSNEILGGYNPIAWKSLFIYGTTDDSFIFSFRNKNINDHIISRVNVKVNAINYWPRYGPSFGNRDLILFGGDVNDFRQKYNYCKKRSYEKNIRETEGVFSVEEYEVFQIIKKN
ncbi:uncharacterized protein OCT59_021176 [Rhizophagus irregularis]|uniref:Kelch-like protein 17 n=2 Tax=Rhizophagus irregularis TaxID=588596 RepID=A0A015KR55_RHIIW|nr:hypothetical protein RirG_162730 [Rhizophagus irregularis DAOM 197198w]UZO02697.1 hypothetical protein OCT59_021176 [Rhizophagus irregularis]